MYSYKQHDADMCIVHRPALLFGGLCGWKNLVLLLRGEVVQVWVSDAKTVVVEMNATGLLRKQIVSILYF